MTNNNNDQIKMIEPEGLWDELITPLRLFNPNLRGQDLGWQSVDKLLTAKKGEHCIVYGLPNTGKTTWLYNVLINQAKLNNTKTLIWSPEDFSTQHVLRRLIHIYMGKPIQALSGTEENAAREFIGEHFVIFETGRIGTDWQKWYSNVKTYLTHYQGSFDSVLFDHVMMLEKTETVHEDNVKFLMNSIIEMCSELNCFAWLVNHVGNPTKYLDRNTNEHYIPPQDPTNMAHGQMWYRLAYNVIEIYRPVYEVYGAQPNEVWVNVRKVKNPDVGHDGRAKLFYSTNTQCYTEVTKEIFEGNNKDWYASN